MNKNFLKVLGLSALSGIIIDAVYRIGIKEGEEQAINRLWGCLCKDKEQN